MDDDEYTIDISTMNDYTSISTITVNSSTLSTNYNFDWEDTIDLNNTNITISQPVEFEDHMPSVAKVEDMCNDYPALRKAYENFKSIYALVKQDWQGKQDEQNGKLF